MEARLRADVDLTPRGSNARPSDDGPGEALCDETARRNARCGGR
jgi:hypothetical protein